MVDPIPKKNGSFLTGYLKEILTGLLFLSIMWVGNNVSAAKTGIALLNKDIYI